MNTRSVPCGARLLQVLCMAVLFTVVGVTPIWSQGPLDARIAASTTEVEGRQPLSLSGAASTGDVTSYTWTLPVQQFDFEDRNLNELDWMRSDGVTFDGEMQIVGTGHWTDQFCYMHRMVGRGSVLEGTVVTPPGAETYCMVGFRSRWYTGSDLDRFATILYKQLAYAIYFYGGSIYIYEKGESKGQHKTYTRGETYEFRIEIRPGGGAWYGYRLPGEPAYTQIHQTSGGNDQHFRAAAVVHSGTWILDDWTLTPVLSGPEVEVVFNASGTVNLTVSDGRGQTDSAARDITVVIGDPPSPAVNAPSAFGAGLDMAFSSAPSRDDYGIARVAWNFGDGTTAEGPKIIHAFEGDGVQTVTVTVMDYAGQEAAAIHEVSLEEELTRQGLVRAVPFFNNAGNREPHAAIPGRATVLKAVASTAEPTLNWTWEFGDGEEVSGIAASATALRAIQASHVYDGEDGRIYTATITLKDGTKPIASDTYEVMITDPSPDDELRKEKLLQAKAKIAIGEALWHLHQTIAFDDFGPGVRAGHWDESGYTTSATASAVHAFEVNFHRPTGNALEDPYVETVNRGLNYLLNQFRRFWVGDHPYGNPDTNQNALALDVPGNRRIYELGQAMDALISAIVPPQDPEFPGSSQPDLLLSAKTGRDGVVGRTLKDLVQDCMDMYFWGQTGGGGWRYTWRNDEDNSACQWAAIGCIPGQDQLGLPIPEWVKRWNLEWLEDSGKADCSPCGSCGYGYTGTGDGEATTPSGLIQLAMDDVLSRCPQDPDDALCRRWRDVERCLTSKWSGWLASENMYAYYAFAKAMWLARPEPIERLWPTGLDWNGDPDNGLMQKLISLQRANGTFSSSRWVSMLATPWAVVILRGGLITLPYMRLEIAVEPPGAGRTTPSIGVHACPEGSRIGVNAFPRAGYMFDRWEGDVVDPNSPETATIVQQNLRITAVFVPLPSVTVEGTVWTPKEPTGSLEAVVGADVFLFAAGNQDDVPRTISDQNGAFAFGEEYELSAGWYVLAANKELLAGTTTDFWANASPTKQDIVVAESSALGYLGTIDDIRRGLRDVAAIDHALLSDVSRLADDTGEAAQLALQIANVAWDIFTLSPGVPHSCEAIRDLIERADFFNHENQAVSWGCALASMDLHADIVDRIEAEDPVEFAGAREFLGHHLAEAYGGLPFAEESHFKDVLVLEQDGVSSRLDRRLRAASDPFRQVLLAYPEEGIPIGQLDRYLAARLDQVLTATDRASMDSQAVLLLPELRESPSASTIPLLLRPTYLDFFKTLATHQQSAARNVVNVGVKVTTDGSVASAVATGPAGVLLGAGVDFGPGVGETYVDGVAVATRAHLAELWGRIGAYRLADLEALPGYLEGIRTFLVREFDNPYYLSDADFQSSIEAFNVRFVLDPVSQESDERRLQVDVTARNSGPPARTVLVVRNFANDDLSKRLEDVLGHQQPTAFFTDWADAKINVLTDMALFDSGRNLATGDTIQESVELLTGVGFLSTSLDLEETQVSVYTGPWETSSDRIFYNGWWEFLLGGGGKGDRLLVHKGGLVKAEDAEAWIERLELEEKIVLTKEAGLSTSTFPVPEDITSLRLSLRKLGGAKMHLLVTENETERQVGFQGEEGREVVELEGSYSGPRASHETITLAVSPTAIPGARPAVMPDSTLTIEVVLDAPGYESRGQGLLALIVRPERPSILGVEPQEVAIQTRPDRAVGFNVQVAEVGGQAPITNLHIETSAVSAPSGSGILPRQGRTEDVSYLEKGKAMSVFVEFDMTGAPSAEYTGTVTITSDQTEPQHLPVTIIVDGTEPTTRMIILPDAYSADKSICIAWSGDDDFTPQGELRFETRLDIADSPSEWSGVQTGTTICFNQLPPGDYTFHVRTVDLAGNADSSPVCVSFTQVYFRRGYVNEDLNFNLADPVRLLSWLFTGGDEPPCLKAADADDNGTVNLGDPIYMLMHLFVSGDPPAVPFAECGPDPSEDNLDCKEGPGC